MKKVDTAGMWNIKGNPITHDGVVMYSGKAIDSTGALGLDKDKLYPVFRPFEELRKACESFNGKPLINNHEMIGTEGGLKKPDDKNIGGTIYNVRPSLDKDGVIIADMTIFSKELQDAITDGKVELSLGYWCKYRPEQGEFNGVPFEFVQYDLEGNHIALVDNGRMGSGVRVFDNAEKTLVFDSMEITMKDKETKDSEALRKLVTGLLKGATDEALAKCKDILDPEKKNEKDEDEKAEEKKSTDEEKKDESKDEDEKSESKDEEKKDEKSTESEDEEAKTEDEEKGEKKSADEDEEKETKDEEKKSAEDSAPTMKQMLAEYSKRENLYKAVLPYTGAFDCAEMTAVEVAKYAAKKMEIATQDGAEIACVENYIKGLSKKTEESTAAMDSVSTGRPSSALLKHLGE